MSVKVKIKRIYDIRINDFNLNNNSINYINFSGRIDILIGKSKTQKTLCIFVSPEKIEFESCYRPGEYVPPNNKPSEEILDAIRFQLSTKYRQKINPNYYDNQNSKKRYYFNCYFEVMRAFLCLGKKLCFNLEDIKSIGKKS